MGGLSSRRSRQRAQSRQRQERESPAARMAIPVRPSDDPPDDVDDSTPRISNPSQNEKSPAARMAIPVRHSDDPPDDVDDSTPRISNPSQTEIGDLFLNTLATRQPPVLVIAIDLGTTYSGYAYSYYSDFRENPFSVNCLNVVSPGQGCQSAKVPTVVLFSPERQFVAFGQEAQNQYAEMSLNQKEEAEKWYYFECFKMALHIKQSLSRDLHIPDFTQKKGMLALDVFAAVIRYLKDHVIKTLKTKKSHVKESEITWVLTVPALWDDSARQFMREAAVKGGIDGASLQLALEPEAAAIYCLGYYMTNSAAEPTDLVVQTGTRFLTVDCGGGTVDISAFEISDGFSLRQLHRPEGAACGGTNVDTAFKNFLVEIFGFDGVTSFNKIDLVSLFREFELAKPASCTSNQLTIKFPESLTLMMKHRVDSCEKYRNKIRIVKENRLSIDTSIVVNFFDNSKTGIVRAVTNVLRNIEGGHVDAILLAGGLAESKYIQEAVTEAFPQIRIVIPPSPSSTVMIGAVIYGHNPKVIASRMSPFTYGVDHWPRFIDGRHDPQRRIIVGQTARCSNAFDAFIRVNELVKVNAITTCKTYFPVEEGQTDMDFDVYTCTKPDPKYTTEDGCQKIGEVTVKMPVTVGERTRKVFMTMLVGGTELRVVAVDETTREPFEVKCDFLCNMAVRV